MYKNFTRRHNLDKPKYDLKYEYMPLALRFDIYKLIISRCESIYQEYSLYRGTSISINKETVMLYSEDDILEYYTSNLLIELLSKCEWHEILSILEYLIINAKFNPNHINELLEYHKVGYIYEHDPFHHSNGQIIVNYNDLIEEKNEIEIIDTSKFQGTIDSLEQAYKYLYIPKEINCAHSIKASIDAIEGFVKKILEEKGIRTSTLGDAIKELKKKELCPEHICESLLQLYVYRNRTGNVGHGSADVVELEKEDAVLCYRMAISFINYFNKRFNL